MKYLWNKKITLRLVKVKASWQCLHSTAASSGCHFGFITGESQVVEDEGEETVVAILCSS